MGRGRDEGSGPGIAARSQNQQRPGDLLGGVFCDRPARELLLQDAIVEMIVVSDITMACHEITAQRLQREIATISRFGD